LSNRDRSGRRYAEDRVVDIPDFIGALTGSSCCADGASCGDVTDQRSNKTCTILVEVTNACNLACPVCYSDAKGDKKMPLETFKRYITNLVEDKGGLDSVQLTGGEATLHPEFWDMVDFLHGRAAIKKIYIPTNGIELAREGMSERLVPFRDKVMVLLQFDGTREPTRELRAATLESVRDTLLERLDRLGVPMQLTMTIARGVNDAEVGWVVDRGMRHRSVKVVALQPVTYSGRYEIDRGPMDRATLSDIAKAVVTQAKLRTREEDFVPIPCSHPNCGWVTLYLRRFGLRRTSCASSISPRSWTTWPTARSSRRTSYGGWWGARGDPSRAGPRAGLRRRSCAPTTCSRWRSSRSWTNTPTTRTASRRVATT
jgi:hypothetical protein